MRAAGQRPALPQGFARTDTVHLAGDQGGLGGGARLLALQLDVESLEPAELLGYEIGAPVGELVRLVLISVAFAARALALGVGASALLTRRLNRLAHGLEPHELTELLYEREAVLHGIGEGMLAVDAASRVSARDDEAERLLGKPLPVGAAVSELDLSPRLGKAGGRAAAGGQPPRGGRKPGAGGEFACGAPG